jgi:isochorismate hydrolase
VVRKQRYSGFAGTSLDLVLKTLGAKYLLFIDGVLALVGVAAAD